MIFKITILFLIVSGLSCGPNISHGPIQSELLVCPEGEGPSSDEKEQFFSAIENSNRYANPTFLEKALKKYKHTLGVKEKTCPARAKQYLESVISLHN